MRPPLVVRNNGSEPPQLLCPCANLLPIRRTAYGVMAVCSTCNVRWTAIRETAVGVAWTWVAERR